MLIHVPPDLETTIADHVVVTLDLSASPDTGRTSTAWLRDAHASLVAHVAKWEVGDAEFSGALARTGDASLSGGMWRSSVTAEAWEVVGESLAGQPRGDASWWVGWLSAAGPSEASARADAILEDDGQGVGLSAEVSGPDDLVVGTESELVDVLGKYGNAASYGSVGGAVEAGRTALDRALRRPRAVSLSESRQWLRGYDWVTLVPPELAGRIDRAHAEDELDRVVELPGGALVLVGTDRFSAFDEAALERVFDVVEPVLPRGEPQRPKLYGDEVMPRLVWRAAERS